MSTLKTNFAVSSKYEAFYTGGKIQVSSDGVYLFCGCGNKVNVLEVDTGKVHITIGQDEDEEISSFCITPDDQHVILATQNLLLRQWNWREGKLVRTWKAIHFAPVVSMTFDSTSTLLATGSADSTIKVWDIEKQYCTHNLRGHQGIISVVAFHPEISRLLLYTAGEDYKIRVWNLRTSKCISELAAHYSMVTSIGFSTDGTSVYTTGRDGVVSILDTTTHAVRKTIPVFEVVESLVMFPGNTEYPEINVDGDSVHFITAGNKGILRLWNSDSGKCVFTTDAVHSKHPILGGTVTVKQDNEDTQNIVQMVYNKKKNNIAVVTYDQNISILGLEKLRLQKQFAGNNDDILDVKYFGEEENLAVVATNSQHIKVFDLSNWDCEILYGHTDIVLCIDVVPRSDMFISAGKDNTVRLWKINPTLKQVSCLAIGQGHTHAIGAVAMSRVKPKFFVSGSEDCTLKIWTMPDNLDLSVPKEIHAAVTEKAHDKTISSVAVAPNDKFIASGSMDKTAKLWNAGNLSLIGVMHGHKRGIWCVQFSPVDQILATSSGDGTVKLWSLTDFTCVRTFEGHDCAVLRVMFMTRGMQLLTSGTNGLVKLWTIKNNECVRTLDEHVDKVWAMATSAVGNSFITGGADSNLIIWKDVTETEQSEARQKQEQFILQDQELSNLVHQKKYLKAIGLAITLEQPFRLLNILKEILSAEGGDDKLDSTLQKLRMDQIDTLLRFSIQWNTNSRHCHEAQVVISAVLKMYPPQHLKQLGNLKSSVEGLLPYTERHFNRMSRLVQQSMFLEYTWQCMKGITSRPSQNQSEAMEAFLPSSAAEVELNSLESEEEPDTVQQSAPSSREPDWSSTSSSENEEERVSMETSQPSTAAQGTSNTCKSESEDEDEHYVAEPRRSQRRIKDRKAKWLKPDPDSNKTSKGISLKYPKRTTKRLKTGLEKVDKEITLSIDAHNESNEEPEESESEKENTCANVEVGIREIKQETKNILNSTEDSEQDSQESSSEHDSEDTTRNTPSSVLSEREVHRAIDRESTGKRHEKDTSLSIEESSESDDDSESEAVEANDKDEKENSLIDESSESDDESVIEAIAVNVKGEKKTVVSKAENGGTGKVKVVAMEAGEESSSDTDSESDLESGNIRKNLFKRYIFKTKTRNQQESKDTVNSSKTRRGEKRKETEAYTAVKLKTPKVLDMKFIDGTPRQQTGTNNNTKHKPTTLMSANKLRKLKRSVRR